MDSGLHTIKIAFGSPWKNIHPGLQHTLIGDLTLSNQFEALLGINENAVYVPLAAKDWTVSSDFRKFVFKIDTSKKFSDGVALTSKHFKESWESALKFEPKSSNSSLLDVLYKVEGFTDFNKTGTLKGVIASTDDTLEVHFSSPFRMAMEHLSGNRFSAFREVNGKFLGTGAYIIEEKDPEHLLLTPNPYYANQTHSKIELSVVTAKDSVAALKTGKIDVMAYAMGGTLIEDLKNDKQLSVIVGQDALHRSLYMNEAKGRLFEKKEYRQALQFLIFNYLENHSRELGNPLYTSIDPQVYLPIQAGRVDDNIVSKKIAEGQAFVNELRIAAQKNSPVLIETEEFSIRKILENLNIQISPKSRTVTKSELINIAYAGVEADLLPSSFGVASGDPDGIYHLLGKNGAITTPMVQNTVVANVLEEGRKIIKLKDIDTFYQMANLTILDQAPIIHMGFNKVVAIYRNDRIKLSEKVLRRNEGHLHIFEVK